MPDVQREDTLIGHTLGRYLVKAYVGDEQLGKVYAAYQLPRNDLVSLKVLHPHLCDNPETMGRFGREMLATATVNHPNSVTMLDFGDHRGIFHYIVLEHLDCHTLADEIKAGGTLGPDRAVHIAAQVASALAAAHGENIIHRNLSNTNVVLLNNAIGGDYVKVRDFGLSRLQQNDGQDSQLTAVGARVGTIAYMAPEYIGTGRVDPRGDLYALGCLMYEMLSGSPPYGGKSSDVLEAHVSAPVPSIAAHARSVPPWLDRLVTRLLQKEPEQRPRDAAEVIDALRAGTGRVLDPPALAPLDGETSIARAQRAATDRAAPASVGSAVALSAGLVVVVGVVLVVVLVLVVAIVLLAQSGAGG